MLSWSRDQRALYFKSILGGINRNTFMIPLRSGEPCRTSQARERSRIAIC